MEAWQERFDAAELIRPSQHTQAGHEIERRCDLEAPARTPVRNPDSASVSTEPWYLAIFDHSVIHVRCLKGRT